jgi:hypothetical protein
MDDALRSALSSIARSALHSPRDSLRLCCCSPAFITISPISVLTKVEPRADDKIDAAKQANATDESFEKGTKVGVWLLCEDLPEDRRALKCENSKTSRQFDATILHRMSR